ncbi:permease [Micromonospora sp. MP36]|nr:permease [Micromonospora sp. MP36]
MTPAHWVYLAGLASLIIVMVARKNVVVPAIAATFLTAVTFTGSVPGGVASVFRASLVAASELFNIFLIIALVTAMLAALRAIGAEHRMVAPFRRLMVNGPIAYLVLFIVTYVFALFFWPTPTLALIAAILLPAAIRAGLSPMAGAIAIAIAGQGMALASDYVIGVAPALSASGAKVPADLIADRALILSWVVGIVALGMSYLMTVRRRRPGLAAASEAGAELAASRAQVELAPAGVAAGGTSGGATGGGSGGTPEQLGQALATKQPPREALADGQPALTDAVLDGDPSGRRDRRAKVFAVLVPASFGALLIYMLLGRFTHLVSVDDGAGAPLVGGLAALLLLAVALTSDGVRSLESCAEHIVDGLSFAFKAMGVVIPIAGFVFIGISDFSGRIMGLADGTTAPGFLFDAIRSVEQHIPHNPFVIMFAVLLAGMTVGLDGSGWAGLPLTGSLSEALSPHAGVDTATLAAIAQNGASWTGGGTLVIWSSLIAVATFCGVSVVDLARKLFLPVVTGLVVSAVVAAIIW